MHSRDQNVWHWYAFLFYETIIEEKLFQEPEELAEMIAKVLKMGLEGLVLKNVNVSISEKSKSPLTYLFSLSLDIFFLENSFQGTYEPGKRHWLKVKKDYLCGGAMADTADLVVLGAWYGTGHKGFSLFL